jgi:hypothetical protein
MLPGASATDRQIRAEQSDAHRTSRLTRPALAKEPISADLAPRRSVLTIRPLDPTNLGPDDGGAGVREPRRPPPPLDNTAADLPRTARGE